MKKIILFLSCIFLLSGCKTTRETSFIEEFNKKIDSAKNYQITGVLEVFRNEEKFSYDIISTYQEKNLFNVRLINKSNNHEQIILKDNESVYVLTPSLNKSFKFQSEWPYNNSQIYLLQPILKDIKNDKNRIFEKSKTGYIVTSKVNYSSEKTFVKQKIYFDLNKNMTKVEVVDGKDNVKMCLKITSIEYNRNLDKNLFDINKYYVDNKNQDLETNIKENDVTFGLHEIIYPMYVPKDTYLSSQDIIEIEDGERVILTFSGDSQFILFQETLSDSFRNLLAALESMLHQPI